MADLSLSGVGTGMDWKGIVDKLMQYERQPLYNYNQKIQNYELEKNAWQDVNSRLSHLEGKVADLTEVETFTSMKSSSSDKDMISASVTSDAVSGSYEIDVIQMAKAHRISGDKLSDDETAFKDLFTTFSASSNIMINGTNIEVTEDDTLVTLQEKINQSNVGANATVVDNHLILESTKTGTENEVALIDDNDVLEKLGLLNQVNPDNPVLESSPQTEGATTALNLKGSFEVKVDGVSKGTITVTESSTLNTISNDLNGLTDISSGVNAGALSIDAAISGDIELVNTSGTDEDNIIKELNIGNKADIKTQLQATQNAEVSINGINNITSQSNTFSEAINGVSFTVKDNPTETVTIDVSKDLQKAVGAIQDFVKQYNSVESFIDNKTHYNPDEQDAGVLQGDPTLMRIDSNLRTSVTSIINNNSSYDQLAMVGVSIDKEGKMSFDSSKFKDALQESPEEVQKLFTATEDTDGFSGIGERVDNYLNMLLKTNTGVLPEKVDYYDTMVEDVEEQKNELERQLEMTRERYTQQFTAMEKAITKMRSQQSWMMSQLSSLGGSTSLLSSL